MVKKRKYEEPEIQIKKFTSVNEINKGIEKIKRRIEQVRSLEDNKVQYDDQLVDNVEFQIRETIREIFGPLSPEFRQHRYHTIWKGPHIVGDSKHAHQRKFLEGIPQTISMLEGLIKYLEEKCLDFETVSSAEQNTLFPTDNKSIFVVHGHQEAVREKVARFIEKLGLNPIILNEQPNLGQTLIEKFEKNTDVGFAVVLLTADDLGCQKEESNPSPRARQNVIFELGYFVGKLSRARVCVLYEEGVELPSDIYGLAYYLLDDDGAWRFKLIKELKSAGYDVDANKAI